MVDTQDITQRVQRILSEHFGLETSQITPEKTAVSLNGDVLDWVVVCIAIEDEFGVEIPDDDWEVITTVQHIVDDVTKRLAAA